MTAHASAHQIVTLKAQAKNLAQAMANIGVELSHAQALEAIAQQYGLPNWDTLSGILSRPAAFASAPSIAQLPEAPFNVWVEQGIRSVHYEINECIFAALRLAENPTALEAYITAHPESFEEGLQTVVLGLDGDEGRLNFTAADLSGIRYAQVGMGNWRLAGTDTYLRFCYGDVWVPAESSTVPSLAIPQMAKSAKGCQLVVLPSVTDGYERQVLVPPRLDAKVIAAKLDAELRRLKDQDRANPDGPEYQEEDLAAFVTTLGCEWVNERVVTSENWDY